MTQINKKREIFEKIPVRTAVLKQIIPAIASQMIVLIYNLADTYFVGWLNDPRQTAAVAIVAPTFIMLTAISNLFGVGGASMIAQSLGKKDSLRARQISTVSIYGGIVCALLFSLLFMCFASPVLRLCGAKSSTFDYAKWVIVIGGPATILNTLLANLIRADGDAVAASLGVSLGGILNIVLDIFLVLPDFLGFGVVGAGIATAISNLIATIFFIIYIIKKQDAVVVSLHPQNIRAGLKYSGDTLAIGFPSAMQYALTVVAVAAQAHFVSKYDTEAVAGLGIVKKLDQLPLYFSIGVANGLLPLIAYNFACRNHTRQKNAFIIGCSISFGFSVFCLICYEIFAPYLTGLFIDDSLTSEYGASFLRIMVTAMPMMSICYPMIIQFQAMGMVRESLICSILRKGVLDIPLLFLMDSIFPLYGCMIVQPIVDTISLFVAIAFYRRIKQKY